MHTLQKKPALRFLIVDIIERVALAAMFTFFFWRLLSHWLETGNTTSLILLISEGTVVLFMLFRRFSSDVSLRPTDWLIALLGTTVPLLVQPTGDGELAPAFICTSLMLLGIALQIAAKFTLPRSFGVVAANRGLKISGPYRLVRHPMYAGYLVTQIGFLLESPSAWNVMVYAFGTALQLCRILAEERVLSRDIKYREFTDAVPYRLVPRVF